MRFTRRVSFFVVMGLLFAAAAPAHAGDGTKITIKNLTIPGIIIGVSVDVNPVYFQNTTKFWYSANGGAFLNVYNIGEFKISPGTHTVYTIDSSSAFNFATATITATTFTVKKGKNLKLKVTGSGNLLVISEL